MLTRQNLPTLDRTEYASAAETARGAYVLKDAPGGKPAAIVMASGSEVSLAVSAAEQLNAAGVATRVVSVPSMELFAEQDEAYQHSVLPPSVSARVAVEAGVRQGWGRWIGDRGAFVGMEGFGASAPFAEVYAARGITAEAVVERAKELAS